MASNSLMAESERTGNDGERAARVHYGTDANAAINGTRRFESLRGSRQAGNGRSRISRKADGPNNSQQENKRPPWRRIVHGG